MYHGKSHLVILREALKKKSEIIMFDDHFQILTMVSLVLFSHPQSSDQCHFDQDHRTKTSSN